MTKMFRPVNYVAPVSDKKNILILLANAAQAFTVPTGYSKVFLSVDVPGLALWVQINAVAVIPTITVTDGSAPMLNPAGFEVTAADTISCICASACTVQALFFA